MKAMKTGKAQDLGRFPKLSVEPPTATVAVSSSQNQVCQL